MREEGALRDAAVFGEFVRWQSSGCCAPMAFFVPTRFAGFARDTERNIKTLVQRNALQNLELVKLRQWLCNFEDEAERYLAAHILDALVYRSDPMIASSCRQVIEMVLPQALKRLNLFSFVALDDFITALQSTSVDPAVRFVELYSEMMPRVAKSGPTVLRAFLRATGVNDQWCMRPLQAAATVAKARALVILDDFLGSGKQFASFFNSCDFSPEQPVVFVPLIAHERGIAHVQQHCKGVIVAPVETVGSGHDFFAPHAADSSTWARDGANLVADVKQAYRAVMRRHAASARAFGNINVTVAFAFSTPNNSLAALYSTQGRWRRLCVR